MTRRSFGGGGGSPGGGAVDSVNGQTGVVVLDGDDIGPPQFHAPTHEAGGSDPIEELGTLDPPFVINDAAAHPILSVTEPNVGEPSVVAGLDSSLLHPLLGLPAYGDVFLRRYDAGAAETIIAGITLEGGVVTILAFDGADTAILALSPPGVLTLNGDPVTAPATRYQHDGADPIANIGVETGGFLDSEFVVQAGGALAHLYNPDGNSNLYGEMSLTPTAAVFSQHDGAGVMVGTLNLGIPGSNALAFNLADGSPRVAIKDDGTGVTLNLANGDPAVTLSEAGGLTILEAGGVDPSVKVEPSSVTVYDGLGAPQHVLSYSTANLGSQPGALVQLAPNGPTAFIGAFGATPYGQDAYLAPLDDNLSALTTLVDLITAENATRTRVNAINGYLIARGFEAAA